MKKAFVLAAGSLVVLLAASCGGNLYTYEQRTSALEQQWKEAEAAGVPTAKIAPLRAQLAAIESRHGGATPYAITSLSVVRNPFADLQAQTRVIYEGATRESRARAETALAKLTGDYAPTHFDGARYRQRLDAARKPLEFQKLANTWTAEDRWLLGVKQQLQARGGGLSGGWPLDVITMREQVQQTVDRLRQAQLWTAPADTALPAAQQYLGRDYSSMLAQHDDVARQLQRTLETVGGRLSLYETGVGLVNSLPGLLPYGDGSFPPRADQARRAFQAARDDGHLQTAVTGLQGVANDLRGKKQEAIQRLQSGTGGCESNASGKTILISLSAQRLIGCDATTTAYNTLITTGKTGLGSTPTGTFQITLKQSPWLMRPDDDCKQGQACWYEPTKVNYVMLFKSGGYFLHDWPPQEGSAFGPGTQNGRFGSHGCVHVPTGVLAQLYNWAPTGTTVIITG